MYNHNQPTSLFTAASAFPFGTTQGDDEFSGDDTYTMVHTDASIPVGSVSRVYDFYVGITTCYDILFLCLNVYKKCNGHIHNVLSLPKIVHDNITNSK